jgi:hypothetical protein
VESLLKKKEISTDHAERSSIQKSPFILLLQHSRSFSQRYDLSPQSTLCPDSGKLWLDYIVRTVLLHSDPSMASETPGATGASLCTPPCVLFLATIPPTKNSTAQYFQSSINDSERMKILQIDPIDWNDTSDHLLNHLPANLERLDTIISSVQHVFNASDRFVSGPCVLIFDSIVPILMRHGFHKTLQFLQEFVRSLSRMGRCRLAVVPIQSEMLTAQQHQAFENVLRADAILNVSQPSPASGIHSVGDSAPEWNAVLLRRGIRESDFLHRETIPYTFITATDTVGRHENSLPICRYEIDFRVDTERVALNDDDKITANTSAAVLQEPAYKGKSIGYLQLDDGNRTSVFKDPTSPTQRQSNIFLQDDDPEFEDYDEDEPTDDDLNL